MSVVTNAAAASGLSGGGRAAPLRASGLGIIPAFDLRVLMHPASPAVQQGRRTRSYLELDDRTRRLADALAARGIVRGDRIAVLAENCLEYIEIQLAAARLGVTVACQNWRLSTTELCHCIGLAAPKLLIVTKRYEQRAPLVAPDVAVLVVGEAYEAWIAAAQPLPGNGLADPEDGIVILYTSGTTGLPKGAVISHRAMVSRCLVNNANGALALDGTQLAWAPLFHMIGTDMVLGTLIGGGKVIVTDGFTAAEVVEIVGRERLGWLNVMPGVVEPIIDEMTRTGIRPVGIRAIGCMADLVPRHQLAEITRLLGAPYANSFGSTETGSPPATRSLIPIGTIPDHLRKEQSRFCDVVLLDEEDRPVAPGQPGAIAVRGPTLFSGYVGDEAATARDFRNGWFHMGDVFVRHADGTLEFVDRRKYLIKSGGENIYPAEIERVLLASDRIVDAAVVRSPHPGWGEVPVVFVVRSDPHLTEADVIALCRAALAGYKTPKAVHFVGTDELPRNATGKIVRHELERRLAAMEVGA
ncbi:long-chain fatty acid--CoA ligase [Methylobacterium terricola]|uniref:Long-chain fatty acid--CoA ligase n=1 Tax=Methylobacterium terricola TaxID=2583531 RepID=A0A5C4LGD4_9HYPH|nr:AMP-binding protein [Methylobacterium terricola]TNC13021.1 long-chain fatty acid--CoA ligase [Methylobacterium terricola]